MERFWAPGNFIVGKMGEREGDRKDRKTAAQRAGSSLVPVSGVCLGEETFVLVSVHGGRMSPQNEAQPMDPKDFIGRL